MSPRPKLITPRGSLQEAIKITAWKQIAETGAPALSLRAIARDLMITAPAIYNYYPSRDDLVTALIVDAYLDLGDTQLQALQPVPEDNLPGRLMAVGIAYRAWALAYPERYQLIFGTPIPGYVAPEDKTRPVAAHAMSALVATLDAFSTQGRLKKTRLLGVEDQVQTLSIATMIWARVHGLVSLEISNNLPPMSITPQMLFQHELETMIAEFIV